MVFLFLITLTFATECNKLANKVYTVEEAFECINSIPISTKDAKNMITSLKNLFESYVFLDICKAPPQPSFDSEFFPVVDIQKELDLIEVENQQMYTFNRKIQHIIDLTHDLHLSLRFTSTNEVNWYFDNFYAALPITFDIIGEDYIIEYQDLSAFGLEAENDYIENDKEIIETINGQHPREFIKYYAEQFTFLKSPHGRFTYAMETMSFATLRRNVLPEEFLKKPILIQLKNGKTLNVSYKMIYVGANTISQERRQILRNKEDQNVSPLKVKEVLRILKNEKIEEQIKKDSNENVFDLESSTGEFACKFDHNKKANVIVLKTFYPTEGTIDFFKKFEECIQIIDKNDYPIIVILPMNGGGLADLEANFEQILAPHADVDLIGSVRISKPSEGVMKYSYGEFLYDTKECKPLYVSEDKNVPLGDFYSNPKKTYYENGKEKYEHIYSQESLMHASTVLKSRLINHPRKPTEVVLFTDGFCYSACSVLTKGMVNKGNGIVVGYHGDPELGLESFDAGNSPTPVVTQDDTHTEDAKVLGALGGMFKISYYETFEWNYNYTETIPREFVLNPVDDRVKIYRYKENKIDQFIDEGLKIIKKYQSECNPLNERLTLIDSDCDKEMKEEHMHGGHICTKEKSWSKECVPAYCDEGFKYDRFNKKCIVDICYKPDEKPSEPSDNIIPEEENNGLSTNDVIIISVSVCGSIVALLLLILNILLIVYLITIKKNKKSSLSPLE